MGPENLYLCILYLCSLPLIFLSDFLHFSSFLEAIASLEVTSSLTQSLTQSLTHSLSQSRFFKFDNSFYSMPDSLSRSQVFSYSVTHSHSQWCFLLEAIVSSCDGTNIITDFNGTNSFGNNTIGTNSFSTNTTGSNSSVVFLIIHLNIQKINWTLFFTSESNLAC